MFDTSTWEGCPACGNPIDYCPGHGSLGDPEGYIIIGLHEDGIHSRCNAGGCEEAEGEEKKSPTSRLLINTESLTSEQEELLSVIHNALEDGNFTYQEEAKR